MHPPPATPLSNPAAESLTLLSKPGHEDVVSVVATWHDDHHAGAWAFCGAQPCDAVRRANGGGYPGRELDHYLDEED